LIDHDTVETVNLAPQGYFEQDIGRPKVTATGDQCCQINSSLSLHTEQERFRRSMQIGNVIFLAVDSITTRQHIWDAIKDRADFVCDGRMAAEALRVLTACDRQGRAHYPTTMFTAEQAYAGACTAKSTIYCANVAAGLMVGQFTKWLRNMPVDPDICLNLLSAEFNVLQPAAIG
jgi:sulfur carrier protein ThiS adenylyltransferase